MTLSRAMALGFRLIREERGSMQFLYASLAVFAALAVAAGEGLADAARGWLGALGAILGL
jgi:hypothetical protein